MKKKIIIVGAGGHSKVVTDMLLECEEYEIMGYVDYDFCKEYRGIKVIGTDEDLEKIYEEGSRYVFVALGDNKIRKKVQKLCMDLGYEVVNIVSKNAHLSPTVQMGKGNAVMPGAILHADVVLGDGCIINTNASVDHDGKVGDYTHVAPGTAISGFVSIGTECLLGTGCRVIDKVNIGNNVVVGAGGVIIRDIPDNSKVAGVPVKDIRD